MFLKIDKERFGKGLNANEIIILAQVEEYERNGNQCFISDEGFAEMLGVSSKTANRVIKGLIEDRKILNKEVVSVSGNGKSTKKRYLSINKEGFNNIFGTDNLSSSNETDNLSISNEDGTDKMSVSKKCGRDNLSIPKAVEGTICPSWNGQNVSIKDKREKDKLLKEKEISSNEEISIGVETHYDEGFVF